MSINHDGDADRERAAGSRPCPIGPGGEFDLVTAFRRATDIARALPAVLWAAGFAEAEVTLVVAGLDAGGGPIVHLGLTDAGWVRLRRMLAEDTPWASGNAS